MADSVDKFGISLDLDISGLQSEMVKAENELRKFQAELKRSTDTAQITKLTASISNLDEKIAHLGQRMGNTAKPTADATNALTNLSRVAQDAPYGFMGIANNLNPMLESFQRLQKESGGTGNALKSLASGLMGPAGIGLALGAVSSLLVAFGDDIMEFINKTTEFEKAQKSMRDGFAENTKSIGETIAKDEALISVITDVTQSTEARNEALKKLKNEYKGNIELQKTDIEDGKLLEEILKKISAALLRKAEIEAIIKVIGEEYSKQVRLQISTTQEQVKNLSFLTKAFDALKATMMPGNLSKNFNNLVNTDALAKNKKDIEEFGNAIGKLQTLLKEKTGESFKAGDFGLLGGGSGSKAGKGVESEFAKANKAFENALDAEKTLLQNNLVTTKQDLENKINIYQDFIKKLASINTDQSKAKIQELIDPLGKMQVQEVETRIKDRLKAIDNMQLDAPPMSQDERDLNKIGPGSKIILNRMTGESGTVQDEKKFAKGKKQLDEFWDEQTKKTKIAQAQAEEFAGFLASNLTNGIMSMWDALENGENVLEAFGNFLKDMVKQLAAAVIQAILFQSIMSALGFGGAAAGGAGGGGIISGLGSILGFAEGGIVSQPTIAMVGEGGQSEAIMPLNKLGNMMNSTFNAGAMSGQGGGGNGQFVLKGNDLVLALQRSNYSLNLRRGA